jgi:hypothetical protein
MVVDLTDDTFGANFGTYLAVGRSARTQAGYQLAGLGTSIGIGIVGGIIGGFIASRSFF